MLPLKLLCRCGHAKAQHAPGSGACMALSGAEKTSAPPVVLCCPCAAFAPPSPEPMGRWALRMAGIGLEVGLAAASIARSSIASWWASWRQREPGDGLSAEQRACAHEFAEGGQGVCPRCGMLRIIGCTPLREWRPPWRPPPP